MKRKQFKALAEILRWRVLDHAGNVDALRVIGELASDIADECARENGAFDRGKFYHAAMISEYARR